MNNYVIDWVPRSKLQWSALISVALFLFAVLFVYRKREICHYNKHFVQPPDDAAQHRPKIPPPENESGLNRKYDLLTDRFDDGGNFECTLDYANANRLPQDHPCVIQIIRRDYLHGIPPPNVPLILDVNDSNDRSPGQTGVAFRILKNRTNGFFAECGALDGDYLSNTVDLERKFNWTGILIEANPSSFRKLLSRNRKAWTLPICLSLEPYPAQVTFQPKKNQGLSHIEGSAKTLQKPKVDDVDPEAVTVQCFPFYSVLLAVGRTQLDFFSLDVEGHELKVLQTIPWHKVNITTLTVEWDNIADGQEALIRFMEESGFIKYSVVEFFVSRDVIFIKDLINT